MRARVKAPATAMHHMQCQGISHLCAETHRIRFISMYEVALVLIAQCCDLSVPLVRKKSELCHFYHKI